MNLIEQIKVNDVSIDGYQGTYYSENPEWVKVITDSDEKVLAGIKADGTVEWSDGVPTPVREYVVQTLEEQLDSKVDKEDGKELIDSSIAESMFIVEDPEYINIEIDSDGKILSGRRIDGVKYENVAIETEKLSFSGFEIKSFDDIEKRIELKVDDKNNIISYRSEDCILHECSGIKTPVAAIKKLELVETINNIPINDLGGSFSNKPKHLDLPFYGYVDIEAELTFTDGTSSYLPTKVSKVGGKYYVTSTLVDGEVGPDSVEVTLVESVPEVENPDKWPATTKTKHYCRVNIDFGSYLSGIFYIEVKFQGDSTIVNPKKNFRFTFYKDILFTKKKGVRIGELIETNKYNLKAYWSDKSLLREPTIYRAIKEIQESREYNKQYPWNVKYPVFTGATGIAMGFPCRIDVAGEFYGVHWFGLAKDKDNFMLDDKTMNGVWLQGTNPGNEDPTYWTVLDVNDWEDLLADVEHEVGPDSLPALQDFYHYINSENGYTFNRATAREHMDVDNWIDAVVILQFFNCVDSLAKNMILYAGEDKQVFSPMYYDMDLTMCVTSPIGDLYSSKYTPGSPYADDRSVWVNFKELFWPEICNRYWELRKTFFTVEYFKELLQGLSRQIAYSDYQKEVDKWGEHGSGTIQQHIDWVKNRIAWLDNYFIK